jgi:hypothetical protein
LIGLECSTDEETSRQESDETLVRSVARLVPDAAATALLRKIEQQLNPPPLTPTPSPPLL